MFLPTLFLTSTALTALTVLAANTATTAHAGSFTYDDLTKLVNDPAKHITSIDDLLAQPEVPSTYREHFTTLYLSQSLQSATPLNPRTILYGEDAKLLMAFTCAPGNCVDDKDPTKPAPDADHATALEVIHYDDATKKFELREFDFPEGRGGKVTISEPNPHKCMGCHMGPEDPRPNWESYFTWPGAYGGNDDHLGGDLALGENMDNLRAFLATGSQRARYRHLESLSYSYENPSGGRDRVEHNIDLTRSLMVLSMERMVDRMRKTPYYQPLRWAFTESALGSSGSIPNQLRAAGFPDLADLAEQCVLPKYAPGHEPEFPSKPSQVARLFYALGLPSLGWFFGFEPTLRNEMVSPADVDSDFWRALLAQDPDLNQQQQNLDQLVADGWKKVARTPGLADGFRNCIAAVGPPRTWR
jgi:hypothetical protein